MDLSGQQGNRELVNNVKMGVRRPSQLGKFAHFRVIRVKLSCREAHQKRFSTKMVSRVAVGEAAGEGVLQEGSIGRMRKIKYQEPQWQYTRPPDDLNRSVSKGFKPSYLLFIE